MREIKVDLPIDLIPGTSPPRFETGVYGILNTVNGKVYIGSAAGSFTQRFYEHKSRLRRRAHDNKHLQAAWNMYGEEVFEFTPIEECSPEWCEVLEQWWIDYYDAANNNNGYNMCPVAGSCLGKKHTAEAKAKVSAACRKRVGEKRSPEARRRIAAALKLKYQSVEYRNKIKAINTERNKSTKQRKATARSNRRRAFYA